MNTSSTEERQALTGGLTKYTQLSEGDPYFFDFQSQEANQELYEATKSRYFEKYPEFARLSEEMEIVFQTFRAEYDRLINLAVGFLRSAELSNFGRWNDVTAQTWNRIVFTHHRVPQEFYDRLLQLSNRIRNEYFETAPLSHPFVTRQTQHASIVEILSDYERVDVSRRQMRELLIPLGLQALIKKDPWRKSNPNGYFTMGDERLSTAQYADNIIRQIAYMMGMKEGDEEEYEATAEEIIRINPSVFFAGFEEAVDLAMHLANRNYPEILRVLHTTKGKTKDVPDRLGRLQDPEFEAFRPFYSHLASMFFMGHEFSGTRVGLNRKSYQTLARVFHEELGLTQAKVRAEVAKLTPDEIQEINTTLTGQQVDEYIGIRPRASEATQATSTKKVVSVTHASLEKALSPVS